jgi:endoglucanase
MLHRSRFSLPRVLIAAVFTCASGSYLSAQVALPALADAYVRAGSFSAQNFGTAHTLAAKKGVSDDNTRRSYLTFDISTVGDTDRVMLRLNGRLSSAAGHNVVTTVYAVPDVTWGETSVTWDTRPNLGKVLGSVVVEGTTAQFVSLDVTKFVRAENKAGRHVISVALRDLVHASPFSIFSSREAAEGAPALIVVPAPAT